MHPQFVPFNKPSKALIKPLFQRLWLSISHLITAQLNINKNGEATNKASPLRPGTDDENSICLKPDLMISELKEHVTISTIDSTTNSLLHAVSNTVLLCFTNGHPFFPKEMPSQQLYLPVVSAIKNNWQIGAIQRRNNFLASLDQKIA